MAINMKNKQLYLFAIMWALIGVCFGILITYFFFDIKSNANEEKLLSKLTLLESKVTDQRNIINAYQSALVGEERDLVSMFDSVNEVGKIAIIVDPETESGLPIKFVLDCGVKEL